MEFRRAHVAYDLFRQHHRVGLFATVGNDRYIASSLNFDKIEPGEDHRGLWWPGDTDGTWLQALVNAAWDAGIRPAQVSGQASERSAHLEDMRKLLFHTMGVK